MEWVRERWGAERVSERRACRVLGQVRSTQRRERHSPDNEAQWEAYGMAGETSCGKGENPFPTATSAEIIRSILHSGVGPKFRGRSLGSGGLAFLNIAFAICSVLVCSPKIGPIWG